MKKVFGKVISVLLSLTLCLSIINLNGLQEAWASADLTATPAGGTYEQYQDVYLNNGVGIGITYSFSNRATVPDTPYVDGDQIRIDEDGILSADSDVLGAITHRQFSYTIRPNILSTYPIEASTNISRTPVMVIQFSRKMDAATLDRSNVTISRISPTPVTNISTLDYTTSYDAASYTMEIVLEPGITLDDNATYMVSLANVRDSNTKLLNGNGTASFSFSTAKAGSITTYGTIKSAKTSYGENQVVAISGTYNEGNIEVNGAVDLQVQVFDPKGVRKSIIPINTVTKGKFSANYTLPAAAAVGTWKLGLYDGNSPRQLVSSSTFTVVSSPVQQPYASPTGGTYYEPQSVRLVTSTTGADIYYTIDYTDDVDAPSVPTSVDASKIGPSNFRYSSPIVISNQGKTRIRAVAILGGVKSTVMDETYTIHATLGYLSLTPNAGAVNVPIFTSVSAVFGRQLRSGSVNAQTFRLRDANGISVAGTVSYNADKRMATFKPSSTLKPQTLYTVTLDGFTGGADSTYIEDLNGVRLDGDVVWTFTTGNAGITVDGRQLVNNYVAVNKSPVEVQVTFPDVVSATMNNVPMASIGADSFVGSIVLKPGNNSVSIVVTDTNEVTTNYNLTVNYLNILQDGASVTVNMPDKGKLDLFDKQLSLNLAPGTYLKDPMDFTGLPLSDQSVNFGVGFEAMPDGFPSVSLVYNIMPTVGNAVMTNSGKGTITISFDSNVSTTSGATLTVLHDADGNGTWEENLGGKVDMGKKTITVPFTSFGRYVVANKVWNFNDYSSTGWAKPYIEFLWAKGYMKPLPTAGIAEFGITDAYGQEIPITRGEFAVLVAKALGYNKAGYTNYGIFSDMSLFDSSNPPYALVKDLNGNWVKISDDDYKYIDMLARNGVINGMLDEHGDLVFDYYDIISREQVAIIIARAMNLKVETNDARYIPAITKMYTDANESIAVWAQPFVLASSKGYFGGFPDKTFRGKDNFTRAQAARIVYLAMEKNKLL